ncbi:DUF3870 domain-containing protein [Sporomusa sp.]|jgi:hypothetical protein|uniref:DUF3870 domain-containing protein n=1 Tax=Sporomusa sp. TaxID=2078658 RepID=UPI002CB1AC75|nr:DUF3870 domain-containing protein [Sporomusa sp.]MDF2876162.1 hypothetical protein [Sporomusa sp.]HWR08890.1 DUF3870 domain-containing protein [Sporomusa sp.]
MFAENTIYIVGNAKSQQNNPITHHYGQFFIGFVVERETGKIVACGSSAMVSTTAEFICSLFAGRSLQEEFETVKQQVESRYFGSSQKAILVAYKDAQKKFFRIMNGMPLDLND